MLRWVRKCVAITTHNEFWVGPWPRPIWLPLQDPLGEGHKADLTQITKWKSCTCGHYARFMNISEARVIDQLAQLRSTATAWYIFYHLRTQILWSLVPLWPKDLQFCSYNIIKPWLVRVVNRSRETCTHTFFTHTKTRVLLWAHDPKSLNMYTHTYVNINVSPHTGAMNTRTHVLPHVLNHSFLFCLRATEADPVRPVMSLMRSLA